VPEVPAIARNATVHEDTLVLIVFSFIPSESEMAKWYWTPVAGVPHLLRNIINVQRGGGKQIYLYHCKQIAPVKELCRLINDDPRVLSKTESISAPEDLERVLRSMKKILILNGSALHHKLEIRNAILLLTQFSVTDREEKKECVSIESLVSQFKMYDDFNDHWLEKMTAINEGEKSVSPSNESIRIQYLSGTKNTKITREIDFHKEHVRIMKSGGLETDSMINRLFSRSVSRFLTRLAIHTPVSPNQVTLLSFILGLISTWFFSQGAYGMSLVGAIILVLSTWIDGVDGELARLTFRESKMGAKLDITLDCLVNFIVFFSIGVGLTRTTGDNLYAILGIVAVLGSIISFVFMNSLISESKSPDRPDSISMDTRRKIQDKIANRDFIFILFLLALIDKTEIFLWLAAIGANVFALYSLYARRFAK
jgi:phosphatidylglycerophosphate synthase